MASLTLNPEDRDLSRKDDDDDDDDDDDNDDIPQLSANALAALQEFLQERQAQQEEEEEEEISAAAANCQIEDPSQKELRHVSEDWQLSQFWYTESTAASLAKEALTAAGDQGRIACVSCPTLYKAIVDAVKADENAKQDAAAEASTPSSTASSTSPSSSRAIVLEFDRRFAKWGVDFVFYDYKDASIPELPVDWRNSFDVVVCDPPFLTEECASATLKAAVETLGKKLEGGCEDSPLSASSSSSPTSSSKMCKVMFCTGEVMAETLTELSGGSLKKSETFIPEHASKLSNPFVLMTNFQTTTL